MRLAWSVAIGRFAGGACYGRGGSRHRAAKSITHKFDPWVVLDQGAFAAGAPAGPELADPSIDRRHDDCVST
jgi:hypothetical protein